MKKKIFLLVFAIIVFYVWTIPLDTPIPGVETYNKIGRLMEDYKHSPLSKLLGIISGLILLYMARKFALSRLYDKL